jgi:hypothetical protein
MHGQVRVGCIQASEEQSSCGTHIAISPSGHMPLSTTPLYMPGSYLGQALQSIRHAGAVTCALCRAHGSMCAWAGVLLNMTRPSHTHPCAVHCNPDVPDDELGVGAAVGKQASDVGGGGAAGQGGRDVQTRLSQCSHRTHASMEDTTCT